MELVRARAASLCPPAPLGLPPDATLEARAEAAAERVARHLKRDFYCIVDDFLPPGVHAALAAGRALH